MTYRRTSKHAVEKKQHFTRSTSRAIVCRQVFDTVELAEMIFTFVPFPQIYAIERVCKSWQATLQGSKKLQAYMANPHGRPVNFLVSRLLPELEKWANLPHGAPDTPPHLPYSWRRMHVVSPAAFEPRDLDDILREHPDSPEEAKERCNDWEEWPSSIDAEIMVWLDTQNPEGPFPTEWDPLIPVSEWSELLRRTWDPRHICRLKETDNVSFDACFKKIATSIRDSQVEHLGRAGAFPLPGTIYKSDIEIESGGKEYTYTLEDGELEGTVEPGRDGGEEFMPEELHEWYHPGLAYRSPDAEYNWE